jgi:hypothetical protein
MMFFFWGAVDARVGSKVRWESEVEMAKVSELRATAWAAVASRLL